MSRKRKGSQLTLGAFGFTVKIKHNKKLVDVAIPKTVDEEETKRFPCKYCPKRFLEKKGLVVHEQFCKMKVTK